ncbi:MAG: nickel pincer cofactor biosynthesis protein LarC [Ignavibacteria bacterium]|nr:nickel pincer cofactor biosynthesis protein LarC [Ignavibacteria bacterium]
MKTAYLDIISGIAGDMTIAAFVSAGVPLDTLAKELRRLPVGPFELSGSHVTRSGIDAVHIDVMVPETAPAHRHLKEIVSLIAEAGYSPLTTSRASKIFQVLAAAEARVHNTTPEKIHFHEVGAVDAIVDIVGTALCLEMLGIDEVYSSAVKVGHGGTVRAAHGTLPVPTPATMEILRGYPVLLTEIPHELTTPTGAAIIAALSSGMLPDLPMSVESIGYGAGTADFREVPNLLRILIGEPADAELHDDVLVIETNIDDMNPEIYPYVLEKLLASGAQEAYLTPVIMKKGRPGIVLTALVNRMKLDDVIRCFHTETTTIGLRIRPANRRKLPRRQRTINTTLGPVSVKVIERDGKETITPEYEECRRIAIERHLPLVTVYRIIEQEARGQA